MQDLQSIITTALDERFELAFSKMRKENKEVRAAVLREVIASDEVMNHPGYDKELKEIVENYFGAVQIVQGEFTRYMYIQGAKDCIVLMKKLEMIT